MKIRHIRFDSTQGTSTGLWLLSKGNKVLYRGSVSPWQSPKVIASALQREGKLLSRVA